MTLAVLIGGLSISLFTFSFFYSVVYKALPIPEGETAMSVSVFKDGQYDLITGNEYANVKDQLTSFSEFGIYINRDIRLSIEQSGKGIDGSYVRAGFFEFSRTQPIIGRTINADDTKIGAEPVTLISYQVWQNELNGDEDVLSKTLILNGQVTSVIGVMPKGYRFPNKEQLWLPLSDDVLNETPKSTDSYYAFGRIKRSVNLAQAELELSQAINRVHQNNIKLYDLPDVDKVAKIMTFQMAQTGGQGTVVFAFLNTVSWLIMLLACINVGNLLLARAVERQKETAIRAALGATTFRLVSQLMWEGIIISIIGGILSLLLVGAALDYTEILLHSWLPSGGSFWWHWGMDSETVMMAVVFTLVTIVLSSLLPAWRSARQDINLALRDGTRGAKSKKAGRISKILVTTQVFLVALLMLIGSISGFIAHKFINLELGDDYTDVITARMTIPENKYSQPEQQTALIQTLMEQVKQHPQVTNVVTNNWIGSMKLTITGLDYGAEEDKPLVDTISVIGETSTVGVNLVAGRQFSRLDKLGSRKTAIISQSMANRYWPGESPLEKDFTITIDDKDEQLYIVGVVTDRMNPSTLFSKLDSADEIYVSGLQFASTFQIFYYHVLPNAKNVEEIFYQAMFKVDRNIELTFQVQPAINNRNKMRESMKLLSNITFGTGFIALLLAMVGIYGLTANAVAQRTHEVGIRRAVGASDRDIIYMFLKQGARQLIIGLGLALVIFALLAYGFHNFTLGLFPVSFYFILAIGVVTALSVVVMFAIFMPTTRAVKMEPSLALRYE